MRASPEIALFRDFVIDVPLAPVVRLRVGTTVGDVQQIDKAINRGLHLLTAARQPSRTSGDGPRGRYRGSAKEAPPSRSPRRKTLSGPDQQ